MQEAEKIGMWAKTYRNTRLPPQNGILQGKIADGMGKMRAGSWFVIIGRKLSGSRSQRCGWERIVPLQESSSVESSGRETTPRSCVWQEAREMVSAE